MPERDALGQTDQQIALWRPSPTAGRFVVLDDVIVPRG
ncbi:hypothetical protein A33M_4083 [Rhodovulum sp. PH10]|nr:hypothetical protein A33M_4083 [Rhodovulum sp. PH10]